MSIAILAWGSLTWNPRELAIVGGFDPIGPKLRLEFTRVSRDNRLTLTIDETVGVACTTFAARSAFEDLDEALTNLWKREGSEDEKLPAKIRTSGRVGFLDILSGERSNKAMTRHPQAVASIQRWGSDRGYSSVIWTILASNFLEEKGEAFSVDAALAHLSGLSDPERGPALEYIRNTPPEVRTPVRTAVDERWPLRDG
jgi:hypothetical protein